MAIVRLLVACFSIAVFGAANAQQIDITFSRNSTPISAGSLCQTVVTGYTFDSTMSGAPSTCTLDNLFPASEPGYLAVGVNRTGTAGYVNITPPADVTFDIDSVTINTYVAGGAYKNNITIIGFDSAGNQLAEYALPYMPGVALYAIPASAGLTKLSSAEIRSSAYRFDFTHLVMTDSTPAQLPSFSDTWSGNGMGSTGLTNNGADTANGGIIELYPSPAYFSRTVTGGSIVLSGPGENFTIENVTWTFNPIFPKKNDTATAALTASGSGIDANGNLITVDVVENIRIYYRNGAWHFGVLNGQILVNGGTARVAQYREDDEAESETESCATPNSAKRSNAKSRRHRGGARD